MALGVTQDLNVYALLKEYYNGQEPEALVFRNDPVLGRISRERIGGKYIPLPMAVYGNGGVSADYTQVTQQAANSYLGVTMQVTPGHLFSSFVLDPQEYLASQGDRAAFLSVFAIKAMLALDDLRKMLAVTMYRMGYLDLGPIKAVDATNHIYVDVEPSTAMAVSPGSYLMFAPLSSGIPGSYRDANYRVVKSIASVYNTGWVRITFTAAYISTVAVGDILMVKGGRDASSNANAPVGLASWLPTVSNRSGATWDAYIATSFYGVDRSSAPDRLAGQYVYRNAAANETYTQALLRLLKNVRRGGGLGDLILVNDDDFGQLMSDALANRTFMQPITGAGKGDKSEVTQGITQFQMGFSTSWINMVYDTPYCPKGTAYILDSTVMHLYSITASEKILDEIPSGNEPGAPKAGGTAEPTKNFMFLADDMYTTTPVALQSGQGLRVDFTFVGNFAIAAPGHCGVCQFV